LSNSFELKTVIPRRIAPCAQQRPSSRGALRRRCCRGPRRPAARERGEEGIRASFLFDGSKRIRRRKLFFFPSLRERKAERDERGRKNQAAARKRSIIFHYELCCGLSFKPLWPRLKRKKVKKQEKSFSASSGRFFSLFVFLLLLEHSFFERELASLFFPFILSLCGAPPSKRYVGASRPAAVSRRGGRVQRRRPGVLHGRVPDVSGA